MVIKPQITEHNAPLMQRFIGRMPMIALVFLLVFGSEFAIMTVLPTFGLLDGGWQAFADSAMLTALVVPGLIALGLFRHLHCERELRDVSEKPIGRWARFCCLRNQYIAIFIILAVGPLLWLGRSIQREITTKLDEQAYKSAEASAHEASRDLYWYMKSIRQGAIDLSIIPPIHGLLRCRDGHGIDPLDGSTSQQWSKRLQNLFKAYIQTSEDVLKVRLIDESGWEQERVQLTDGEPLVVSTHKLEDKCHRYYFHKTIGLPEGQCYVSPLDLNIDNGVLEVPHRPVIRVATPIWFEGRVRGMIVISHAPITMLEQLRALGLGKLYLAGVDGIYLHHPDESKCWANQLGGEETIYKDWPGLRESVQNQDRGLMNRDDRVLTWTKIPVNADSREGDWILGLDWNRASLLQTGRSINHIVTLSSFGVGVIGLFVAIIMAGAWSRPIIHLASAANRMSAGDFSVRVRATRQDEMGILGRAFNSMAEKISQNTENLEALVRERTLEIEAQKFALDQHAIVSITDPQGIITYVNRTFCEVSGYARDELMGQKHNKIKSNHHTQAFYQEMWQTICGGDVWHGEIKNRRKDGSFYWVNATIVPFKNEKGEITQYVAIQTDISDRKATEVKNAELVDLNTRLDKAQYEAQLSSKAKSEFLANISHEIRTPMTAILGFSENLLEGNMSKIEVTDAVNTIHRNGEFLLDLINDILDISKIEAGKMEVEHIACSPHQIISDVVSLMHVRAEEKGLEVNTEFSGPVPGRIQTDPTRLRQILINIIGNAIKFTKQGGIRLTTRLLPDDANPLLQFDIIDTGIGMSPEAVKSLFQAFMQADCSTTRKFGGTGLGLTISKRFAQLLGGDITIMDTKPGQGSWFRVTIATGPLGDVRMLKGVTVVSAKETTERPPALPVEKMLDCRILLAEDGPDNQRLISYIVRKAGADMTVVENGELAVDAALAARNAGKPFDLILMDMQMPVLDGYEATRKLREQDYTGAIIALTAHAMATDREKCIQSGCDDYATKPIDRRKLIEMIRSHLKTATGVCSA